MVPRSPSRKAMMGGATLRSPPRKAIMAGATPLWTIQKRSNAKWSYLGTSIWGTLINYALAVNH
eukprot:1139076-Pelagomonas_calceolata.AAC.6